MPLPAESGPMVTGRDLLGRRAPEHPEHAVREKLDQAAFGRFAPYFERLCLRSVTPCVSSEPRTMW